MMGVQFRAWDEGCKQLFNVNHVENLNNDKPVKVWTNDIEGGYRFAPNNLEQFIGLSDSKGVPIYEGDIVIYRDGEFSFIAKVVKGSFYFYMENNKDSYVFEDFEDDNTEKAEELTIVGNTHENPDLLEDD